MKYKKKYKVHGVLDVVTKIHLMSVKITPLDPEVHIRSLGLTVLRGPTITLLSPVDGLEEIANPFVAQE
jgi:U6 snRNA-associated Sm-like protein LSm7